MRRVLWRCKSAYLRESLKQSRPARGRAFVRRLDLAYFRGAWRGLVEEVSN